MSINRDAIKKIIGFIIFACIVIGIFCKLTYLFRNSDYNRYHIIGIKDDDYDMVYVGGSAAFIYWQPYRAWNDCGFTSYNFATDSVPAENIKPYIEEIRKYQSPELYLVDLRAFQYYSDDFFEAGLRKGSDGLSLFSLNRYEMLNKYLKNHILEDESGSLSYYLDICKYHSNTDNLASEEAWKLSDNYELSTNKGWEWSEAYEYQDTPKDFETDERGQLSDGSKELLVELLDYCKKEKLNVLFVVCPYYISAQEQSLYNTMSDYIMDYGFDYLNTNTFFDEIGIDFGTDFYNKNHVNVFGSEKYTIFLEKYIVDNYNLPDHRGDSKYRSWEEESQQFLFELDEKKEIIKGLMNESEKADDKS